MSQARISISKRALRAAIGLGLALALVAGGYLLWTVVFAPVAFPRVHRSVFRYPARTTDPLLAKDPSSLVIVNNTQEGLLEWVPGKGLRPALAVKWKPSLDQTQFDFDLRPDAVFQDGSRLDADAVKASLDRLAGSVGTYGPYFQAIEKVEVLTPMAVRVHTSRPLPDLPLLLSASAAHISKFDGDVFVGTGPFAIHSIGETTILKRFDRYWGELPRVERLEFQAAAPQWARALADQEVIDDLAAFPAHFPPSARDKGRWKVQSQWSTWLWLMNERKGPFASRECRLQARKVVTGADFRSTFFPGLPAARELLMSEVLGGKSDTGDTGAKIADAKGALPAVPATLVSGTPACKGTLSIVVSEDVGVEFTRWLTKSFGSAKVEMVRLPEPAVRERALEGRDSAYLFALTSEIPDSSYLTDALLEVAAPNLMADSQKALQSFSEAIVNAKSNARRLFLTTEISRFLQDRAAAVAVAQANLRSWQRDCVTGIQSNPLSVGHTSYRTVENRCLRAGASGTLSMLK